MRRQDYNAVFGKGTNQIAETDALFRVKPPPVGSSKIKMRGSLSMACAIPKRCFMPPEKVLILCLLSFDKSTASSSSFDFFRAAFSSNLLGQKHIAGSQTLKSPGNIRSAGASSPRGFDSVHPAQQHFPIQQYFSGSGILDIAKQPH